MTNTAKVNAWYDKTMFAPATHHIRRGSQFHNYGLWKANTLTTHDASVNLMESLLDLIPQKEGKILDVACGKGASTSYLGKYYLAENITAINISERQLAAAREAAPQCQFLLMSATDLQFPNASFDAVLCVEAAFHFETRRRFLEEAARVLRTDGTIALSDQLFWPGAHYSELIPEENYLASTEEYLQLMRDTGFVEVRVVDATEEVFQGFCRHRYRHFVEQHQLGRISAALFRHRKDALLHRMIRTRKYLLVAGRRSQHPTRTGRQRHDPAAE